MLRGKPRENSWLKSKLSKSGERGDIDILNSMLLLSGSFTIEEMVSWGVAKYMQSRGSQPIRLEKRQS